MGRNFYFPRYHALLAQLFHSRVGDPSFSLSFFKDLIIGRGGHMGRGGMGKQISFTDFQRELEVLL